MNKTITSCLIIGVAICLCWFPQRGNNRINKIFGKVVELNKNDVFINCNQDTIVVCLDKKYKVVNYIDSIGCIECKMGLKSWQKFASTVDSITHNEVIVLTYVHTKYFNDVFYPMQRSMYLYPVCVDKQDSFGKRNSKILDFGYNTFLLDENNKVILIGNPVQNPKIRDLYIRTICERLGINPESNSNSVNNSFSKSLGSFNWQTEQHTTFSIHNTDTAPMLIDTVYTSCECTTAEIDKLSILEGDSAIISVSFKAEKPEQFMREVYVGVHSGDEIVLSIEGVAVE